jgi:hypothetical protein
MYLDYNYIIGKNRDGKLQIAFDYLQSKTHFC